MREPSIHSNDIRGILDASERHLRLQSEMAMKRQKETQQNHLVQRKNQLMQHQKKKRDPLAADSLFQPFSQTQSQLPHKHAPIERAEMNAVS